MYDRDLTIFVAPSNYSTLLATTRSPPMLCFLKKGNNQLLHFTYGGFLQWTTDFVSFYVCLGRKLAPKANMECTFSLLLQSLVLAAMCTPLFYAP
jgi:hypothetical protein